MFFILSFILILAAVTITLKILIGYNPEISLKNKLTISFIVIFAWCCPVFSRFFTPAARVVNGSKSDRFPIAVCCFYNGFFSVMFADDPGYDLDSRL